MTQNTYSDRHRDVLNTALALIAERGIHGASLRELARRLGISQPSLYHYFDSKDALLEQLVDFATQNLVKGIQTHPFSHEDPEHLPRLFANAVLDVWNRDPTHENFVRFMFAVALEAPHLKQPLGRAFLGSFQGLELFHDLEEQHQLPHGTLLHTTFMITRALGLLLIEQRVLFDNPNEDFLNAHVDFLVEAGIRIIRGRKAIPIKR